MIIKPITSSSKISQYLKILLTLLLGMILDHFQVLRFLVVAPTFTLPILYFWLLYAKESLPISLVFLLGLVDDGLSGGLFGHHTLLFLICYGIVTFKHIVIAQQNKSYQWLTFGLILGALTLVDWGMISLIHQEIVGIWKLLLSNFISFLIYPWLCRVLNWINKPYFL